MEPVLVTETDAVWEMASGSDEAQVLVLEQVRAQAKVSAAEKVV